MAEPTPIDKDDRIIIDPRVLRSDVVGPDGPIRDRDWSYSRTKNTGRSQIIERFPNGHEAVLKNVDVVDLLPTEVATIAVRVSVSKCVDTLDAPELEVDK